MSQDRQHNWLNCSAMGAGVLHAVTSHAMHWLMYHPLTSHPHPPNKSKHDDATRTGCRGRLLTAARPGRWAPPGQLRQAAAPGAGPAPAVTVHAVGEGGKLALEVAASMRLWPRQAGDTVATSSCSTHIHAHAPCRALLAVGAVNMLEARVQAQRAPGPWLRAHACPPAAPWAPARTAPTAVATCGLSRPPGGALTARCVSDMVVCGRRQAPMPRRASQSCWRASWLAPHGLQLPPGRRKCMAAVRQCSVGGGAPSVKTERELSTAGRHCFVSLSGGCQARDLPCVRALCGSRRARGGRRVELICAISRANCA